MVHAHFLQMGGFRLLCTEEENLKGPIANRPLQYRVSILIRDYRSYFIPPQFAFHSRDGRLVEGVIGLESFRALLKKQLIDFPEISKEDISDKSKGDILSKGVALIQIGWFLLQLIVRSRENLAITELELTTAALAALNFAMYLFWWDKPQDVRCPVVIRTKATERILAETEVLDDWELDASHDFEYFRLRNYLKDGLLSTMKTIGRVLLRVCEWFINLPRLVWGLCLLFISSTRTAWDGIFDRINVRVRPDSGVAYEVKSQEDIHLEKRRAFTRERAAALLAFTSWFLQDLLVKLFVMPYLPMFLPVKLILSPQQGRFDQETFEDAKDKMVSKPLIELFFSKEDMIWIMSMMFYSEKADAPPLFYSSAIGGAIFGSIHCFAWNFEFPSLVEGTLWRTAAFSIVGVCVCVVPGLFIHSAVNRKGKSYDEDSHARRFWLGIRTVCELIPCIIYPIARAALLLLAVASLRDIPISALDAVRWTELIPHI